MGTKRESVVQRVVFLGPHVSRCQARIVLEGKSRLSDVSDLRSVLWIRLRLPVLRFRLSPTYTYTYTYSSPGLLWPLPTFLPPNFFISHYYTCSTTRMLTSIGALSP